jgi:hypothetical protein
VSASSADVSRPVLVIAIALFVFQSFVVLL